jgi:hypothetical protein
MTESEIVRTLFEKLINAPLKSFPLPRGALDVPHEDGVYVIYGRRRRVLYVGRTYRSLLGGGSLNRRLSTHRTKYGPRRCLFRYLVVKNSRKRALLEHYATGYLCPADLGLGDKESRAWLAATPSPDSHRNKLATTA